LTVARFREGWGNTKRTTSPAAVDDATTFFSGLND
jgi:hypothetical protein